MIELLEPTAPPSPRSARRFSPLQSIVVGLATIPLLVIAMSFVLAAFGLLSEEEMIELALAAGENPGTVVFGMMFLASPVQWITGRSQIRVRKYLGIVFFLLALNNLGLFVSERDLGSIFEAPFLIAGTVAVGLAAPLFLTSSRRSQRLLGLRRWKLLHKLTYAVAIALLAHVVLIGDLGLGSVLITLGFVARVPRIRSLLTRKPGRGPTTVATPS